MASAINYPGTYPRYYPEALENPENVTVHGTCAKGFESVRDVFKENFLTRLERGAAVCVYLRGEKVVDLWGGERYLGVPWEKDTIVNIFSATKGVAGLGVALLHSKGLIDYEEKVSKYWPEFACNGKENLTVRELLSHNVGVCAITGNVAREDLLPENWKEIGTALATTNLEWDASAKQNGYMGITIGWYDDQLCRRIDPKGRGITQFLKEEVFSKIGYNDEFFLGLPGPDELPRSRIASINAWSPIDLLLRGKFPPAFIRNFLLNPTSYTYRTFSKPSATGDVRAYGTEKVRECVIPGANGHMSARALAAIYNSILAAGRGNGKVDNKAGFARSTLDLLAEPAEKMWDVVLRTDTNFSLGFSKAGEDFMNFGSSDHAFGTPGAGGNLGFADPDADVAFGYVTNRMGTHLLMDPRELALRAEVYKCLEKMGVPSRPQRPDAALEKQIREGTEKELLWADPVLIPLISNATTILATAAIAAAAYFMRDFDFFGRY